MEAPIKIGTPNMPGSWYEEFEIGLLDGAFSIHSADPDDVSAMRSLFGNKVGETSLFDSVLEAAIILFNMEELPDEIIEVVAKKKGCVQLGITHLTNRAALSLAKHSGSLLLDSLKEISDEAADLLSKHEGDINFMSLSAISAKSAESFSKHLGDINFSELIFDDEVALILAKKNGTICRQDPVEWTSEFKSQ
jgi:hypothetical protein